MPGWCLARRRIRLTQSHAAKAVNAKATMTPMITPALGPDFSGTLVSGGEVRVGKGCIPGPSDSGPLNAPAFEGSNLSRP